MDFYKIAERSTTRGRDKEIVSIDIYPDFIVRRSKDLMIRGKSFYAIWNDETGMWSKDEYDVSKLIDQDMYGYVDIMKKNVKLQDVPVKVMSMASFRSNTWKNYRQYINMMADNYHELDERLTFLNTEVKKEDYVSKRLDYALEEGSYDAWDKLVGTLYEPAEREKIEWSIGSIVSGDSRTIQKFCVFYGAAGTGKSTIIKIIQRLFRGYCETFDAKSLASASSQFAMEVFRSNPLVAIQHDGDLSRIEDNTKLNSIVSHEPMIINEKGKPQYTLTPSCFLFMGTNRPVKITEAKSGIKRRLIDIVPSGRKLPSNEYNVLMSQVDFELGAIAQHCLDIYRELGKYYYDKYEPTEMMVRTNAFYNFVSSEEFQDALEGTDGMTLKQAYALYKQHCEDTLIHQMPRYIFKEELKNYFKSFEDLATVGDKKTRSWYSGFLYDELEPPVLEREVKPLPMSLDCTTSLLDDILADYPAQYATEDEREKPVTSWERCKTTTKDLDTGKLHYILPWKFGEERDPERSLVWIDFDLKNEKGEKDALLNMEAASKWPATYSEYSKGGAGIHNYYWYTGDISQVATVYAPGIEIKLPVGYSSIRRRLSKCNNIPIATLNTGALPLKEEKVIDVHELKDVQHLRNKIKRALRKGDNVGGTKCEIDLIKKTLDDAYASGISYDVSDMENAIYFFACGSTNNKNYCRGVFNQMKLRSKDIEEAERGKVRELAEMASKSIPDISKEISKEIQLTFFDIEIYPPGIDEDGEENEGLFLICWKREGEDEPVHSLVNPKSYEVEAFVEANPWLVGYNNLGYDNAMVYFAMLGYNNQKLYDLSQRIIVERAKGAIPYEAKKLSYTDVLDYAATKQGLKKWEIELDIDHLEMQIPWDKPAPKRLWPDIIKYCGNDVIATEKVHNHLEGDFKARKMLANVTDSTPNETTNTLTTRFIFGKERHPNLVYTDFRTGEQFGGHSKPGTINLFEGYDYVWDEKEKKFRNMYRGVDVGRGGYVYSEAGIWCNVALLDVQSMHPNSIVNLNLFGDEYTARFKEILDMRIAIKNRDFDKARAMFGGKLAKYLEDESDAEALAQALKIAINSVYGLTSAGFDNPFKDPRNKNNIVALRGALFMKTLQDEVASRGFTVAHIKTDSIKIPNATPEIIQFCMDFAKKYGYIFEHEATYERMCLLDKAQYVAAYMKPEDCNRLYGYAPKDNVKHFKKHDHPWTTTGDAFQHPYIFKTLFSGEPVTYKDRCETKTVRDAAIYLDMNEALPNVVDAEKEWERREFNKHNPDEKPKKLDANFSGLSDDELFHYISSGHDYQFVGRAGSFFPVAPGYGGGIMYALRNGKYNSVNGSKGYRWLEANAAKLLNLQDHWDPLYFEKLIDGAVEAVNTLCSNNPKRFDRFIDLSRPYEDPPKDIPEAPLPSPIDVPPWKVPCGSDQYNNCSECPNCAGDICKRGFSLASYIENGNMEDDELPF